MCGKRLQYYQLASQTVSHFGQNLNKIQWEMLHVTYSKIAASMILVRWAASHAGNQIKLVTFEQYYNIIPGIPVTTLWKLSIFFYNFTEKKILQHQQLFVESLAELSEPIPNEAGSNSKCRHGH